MHDILLTGTNLCIIYLFMVYLATLSVAGSIEQQMTGLMSNELELNVVIDSNSTCWK
jgi:hypothetical protein